MPGRARRDATAVAGGLRAAGERTGQPGTGFRGDRFPRRGCEGGAPGQVRRDGFRIPAPGSWRDQILARKFGKTPDSPAGRPLGKRLHGNRPVFSPILWMDG